MTSLEILHKARDVFIERGGHKRSLYDPITGKVCALGAFWYQVPGFVENYIDDIADVLDLVEQDFGENCWAVIELMNSITEIEYPLHRSITAVNDFVGSDAVMNIFNLTIERLENEL